MRRGRVTHGKGRVQRELAFSPTSCLSAVSASPTNVSRLRSRACRSRTASMLVMGVSMMGPFVSSISKGIPNAGSGVRMSLCNQPKRFLHHSQACASISALLGQHPE